MKTNSKYQNTKKEHFNGEDGFIEGEAYPNCDGEPCANVAEDEAPAEAEAVKMTDEAAVWRDKYIRLQAEFDNYRKRTFKERMDLISSAGEDVIKALLPVLDDLDRALEAMKTSKDAGAVKEGVVLISNKLRDTLRSKGVSAVVMSRCPTACGFFPPTNST